MVNKNKFFVDRSKFKYDNSEIVGHFSNEWRKPKIEKIGDSSEGIEYRKKYFDILRSKEKAFISEEKDWVATREVSDEE